jgi:hypothetical protein
MDQILHLQPSDPTSPLQPPTTVRWQGAGKALARLCKDLFYTSLPNLTVPGVPRQSTVSLSPLLPSAQIEAESSHNGP